MVNVHTVHKRLQYFSLKQYLTYRPASQYLHMSKFIYHIHYRSGFKMSKPDGLSRHSEEEKSTMDAHIFDEGQLLDLENDNVGEKEDAKDMDLEEIDVAIWEKMNGL